MAASVVAAARRSGAYRLFANLPNAAFNPGFFQGVAGIGYGLLRLVDEDLPSALL
jgi:lantibiotic modifying enzyme